MNIPQKIDGGFSLVSSNGCITYPPSCSSFLVEFGNIALQFTREELNDFIEFLDSVTLPSQDDSECEDERSIVINGPAWGATLLFTVQEFNELYYLLINAQINMILQEQEN